LPRADHEGHAIAFEVLFQQQVLQRAFHMTIRIPPPAPFIRRVLKHLGWIIQYRRPIADHENWMADIQISW
jgi:hypothetical protein